uniref:Uncharacterized protein n=1 Tax=Vespula pensylvanica TaxID=30213 RepID=A0A834P5E6_VESPE|nr:hypothetical protein H0235_005716 [Vespula pensylvanica]
MNRSVTKEVGFKVGGSVVDLLSIGSRSVRIEEYTVHEILYAVNAHDRAESSWKPKLLQFKATNITFAKN